MTRDFPDDPKPWSSLGFTAGLLERTNMAIEAYEEAAKRHPSDPQILLDLSNQRGQAWDTAGAEQALRAALKIDPRFGDAYVALAILYEHANRAELLPALVEEAEQAGIEPGLLSLVQAYAFRREKNWQAALDAALAAREDRDPARRAQVIGEALDRLGRPGEAFGWFETMNRHVAEDPRLPAGQADVYRDMVDHNRTTLTRG
jgi:tetratricopeptide (TPR) repeat protein